MENFNKNWISLSSEKLNVVRDEHGVPIEWTLLKVGDNPLCQEGIDGNLHLTSENMSNIVDYFTKKGELIPIDSEHYLYELANLKKIDEAETLRLFPGGVAALGFGSLALSGDNLRINVKWTDSAYEFMKEKIYKYFSPVLRGITNGPLRVTSVAMTNTPAINNLDALAASATNTPNNSGRKDNMSKVTQALQKLLGRDSIALEAEGEEEKIAAEIEAKANLLDEVKKILKLEANATVEEIIAALKAEAEKAQSADDKQAELDELAAAAEKKAHADLVAQGKSDGKITEADMEYVNSLDSKALSAHLAHTSRKVPVGKLDIPAKRSDEIALSAVDRMAIEVLRNSGIKNAEDEYLKAKKGK